MTKLLWKLKKSKWLMNQVTQSKIKLLPNNFHPKTWKLALKSKNCKAYRNKGIINFQLSKKILLNSKMNLSKIFKPDNCKN
jgi:hypothetical protein